MLAHLHLLQVLLLRLLARWFVEQGLGHCHLLTVTSGTHCLPIHSQQEQSHWQEHYRLLLAPQLPLLLLLLCLSLQHQRWLLRGQ
jgi:hypothetical protein